VAAIESLLAAHDEAEGFLSRPAAASAVPETAARHERQARLVELRYFGGLSLDETAQALDLSAATVSREWSMAKAWLYRRLKTTR
jgi:RNA polymerase sigma-70 factor, ECF subfamily